MQSRQTVVAQQTLYCWNQMRWDTLVSHSSRAFKEFVLLYSVQGHHLHVLWKTHKTRRRYQWTKSLICPPKEDHDRKQERVRRKEELCVEGSFCRIQVLSPIVNASGWEYSTVRVCGNLQMVLHPGPFTRQCFCPMRGFRPKWNLGLCELITLPILDKMPAKSGI